MRKVKAVLSDGSVEKLGKRPFPLKRFILGCVVLAIGIVVAVFIIKNAGAGLSEVNIPVGADTQNSILSKPEEGDPSDLTAVESLFIAAGVLKDAGSFSAECTGTSTSMGVSQGIRSRRTAIGQKAFKEVVSYSAFVKMGEQRYYNGSDYLIRGSESVSSVSDVSWGSSVTPVDKDTYLSRYGYIPCEMTSYILNEESISSGEFVSAENGLYTFHYDLNIQLAPVNLLYEMRTSAGTSNYPKFLSADMTVVMDGDWKVKTVSTSAKYEVAMLGGVTCEESMTETFTQIGGITQLPETEFFAPYFGSETTDEVEKAPDALTAITEIFGDYINGAPLNAKLTLSAPGTEFDGVSALVSLGIDIENTDNITADVRLGGLDFSYKKGALYLSYGDFQGSMTVDGLTSAVGSVCKMLGVELGGMENIDLDSLLGGMKITETDGGCAVSLDADLGGLKIGAAINADKSGDSYKLTSIVANIGDYTLNAGLCDAWDVKKFVPAECPDLLGLLDVLGDGTVSFVADVNGIDVDVQYDIKNNVLNAFAGDLVLALENETLYLQYNDVKLKLKLSDLPGVMDDLSPLLGALGLDFDLSSLPAIDIKGIKDSLVVVSDGTNAKFSLELFGADLNIDLANVDNRWTLAGLGGSFGGVAIDAKPAAARPFVFVDDGEYVSATALTGLLRSVLSEPINLELELSAPGTEFDGLTAMVRLNIDVANTANTTVDVRLGGLDFAYKNGMLYLSYGDFKGSIKMESLASAVNSVCSMFGVGMEMPALDFDLEALLACIKLTETENGCVISLDTKFGDTTIGASVTAAKNGDTYALSSIVAKLGDYTLTANACDAWDVTEFIPAECPDLLGLLDILGDGTLSFAANMNGFGIDVQYDIKNNVLNAFAGDIVLALQDNTLYINYNNIKLKLKLSDIPAVMDDIKPILDALGLNLDLSSLPELDVQGILEGITVESDGTNAKFTLELFGATVGINLANIENRWTLTGIDGSFAGVSIDAKPSAARPFAAIDDREYIDGAALIGTFAAPLAELISAENFAFDIGIDIVSGSTVYSVNAVVNINGGIAVNGTIGVNGMNAIAFDVIYADGIVYLTVNGADFAFNAGNIGGGSSVDLAALLGSLRGYNGTLDAVIDDLLRVINVAGNGVDFGSLVKSLSFDETAGALTAVIGGGQFGLADLNVTLRGGETLGLNVSDFTMGGVGFVAGLSVRPSTEIVTAPGRDYVTDLAIKIDELNTLYLNIDSLNGVYRFRLDDLYGEYSGDTFRINYRDVYLSGNVKKLGAIISALDTIVKDAQAKYAVGILAQTALETSTDGDFLKNLINSLTISANGEKGTLKIGFSIFGIDADLSVACGDAPVMTVNVSLAGKDVTASVADSEISYFDFGSVADSEYVDITTVFKDYLGEFETLAKANSWHFNISAEIELGGAKYLLAAGSGIDLVYYTADKFDIKATLILKKWDGAGYADAYSIKAAYVGGRIYFDYSNANNNSGVKTDNHLKLTLSAEAIDKCADLLPRLLEVVPQIGQLLADMKQSAGDALENLELVKYSSIIKSASYENGTFGLVINMGVILPALGDLDLTVTRNELGGLSLGIGSFAYDDGKGTTFALKNVAVSVAAQTEDAGNANIGEFSTDGYINLDSLYELLSAFTITADNNSFKLSGTAKISLVVTVDIGLELVVDIDKEGYVYVSFRLYREKLGLLDFAGAAFNDYGGYSYLNYNGKTNTVRVIRNSYQKEKWYSTSVKLNTDYGSKKPEYDTGDIPAAQFTENMIDYILQMVNFKGWINDQITGAINKEGSGAVYGIEDILKSYSYTDGKFGIVTDLTPMDSNLGQLSLDIYHDADYNLTKLTASMGLLKDWCTITVNSLDLLPPESGLATTRVENNLIW